MTKLDKLIEDRKATHEELNTLLKAADGRTLTADEEKKATELEERFESQSKQLGFEQRAEARQTSLDAMPDSKTLPKAHLSAQDKKDIERYSIREAIECVAAQRPLQGIVKEMHEEAQKDFQNSGLKSAGQVSIPMVAFADIQEAEKRDQTVGVAADGGNLVATGLGSFVSLLYNRLVLRSLGSTFLTGLVGNVDFPRGLTSATQTEEGETDAMAESSPTYDKVSITPHRMGTYVEFSKQLVRQSSPDVEAIIRNDLTQSLAVKMEENAINGSGVGDIPEGILNTTGIGDVAGGANGAAPDWTDIVKLEEEVSVDNADFGALAYLANTKGRSKLKRTEMFSGTNGLPVWENGAQPLNGYRAEVSNSVPSNLTKGTGTGLSAILFGNWNDHLVGQWGGIDLQVNPYIKDDQGLIRILIEVYWDTLARRAVSFAAMQDAITT